MEEKSTEKKYKYLLKNILLFAISSFIPKLLGFVLIPIYTGALSTEEYGIADLISATSQLGGSRIFSYDIRRCTEIYIG